jgi:hypothetical protein
MYPIIVTGTGSSGTSIVAYWLHTLGIHMGHSFIPASPHNPKGYWECLEFNSLIDYMSSTQGYYEPWKTTMHEVADRRPEKWGFKKPAASHLKMQLDDVFPKARWIKCIRSKEGFKDSCRRAGWSNAEAAWEHSMRSLHKIDGLELDFNDIVQQPLVVFNKIVQYVGLTPTSDQVENCMNFVEYNPVKLT